MKIDVNDLYGILEFGGFVKQPGTETASGPGLAPLNKVFPVLEALCSLTVCVCIRDVCLGQIYNCHYPTVRTCLFVFMFYFSKLVNRPLNRQM